MYPKTELKRKSLHLTGLIIPSIYIYLGRDFTISFLIIVLSIFIALEPIRLDKKLRDDLKRTLSYIRLEDVEKIVDEIARGHEKKRIGAHIFFVVASILVVWFFPQFAVGVVTVAVISDALASLVGKAFGRVKIKNKSLEGFLAYAISAYFILTYFDIPYAFFGALVGALTELFNIPPDDNFSCQIAMAVALYLVNWLSF